MQRRKFHSNWVKYALLIILVITFISLTYYLSQKDQLRFKSIYLSFKIPEGYKAEYKDKTREEPEMINIDYGSGNPEWMSIQILERPDCIDTPQTEHTLYAYSHQNQAKIMVANRWSLLLNKSHPRYGSREQSGTVCLDKNTELFVIRYVKDNEGEVEKQFDHILKSATYSSGFF